MCLISVKPCQSTLRPLLQVLILSEALLSVMRADKRGRFCLYLNAQQHSDNKQPQPQPLQEQ